MNCTATLQKWDEESLVQRSHRLEEMQILFEDVYGFVGSPNAMRAFSDAQRAYVAGMFIACIIMSSSYLENMQRSIINVFLSHNAKRCSRKQLPQYLFQASIIDQKTLDDLKKLEALRKYYDSEYPHWTDGTKKRKGIANGDDLQKQLPKDAQLAIKCIAKFIKAVREKTKVEVPNEKEHNFNSFYEGNSLL